ncbi:MAG: hypothetical protein JW876_04240 [Candidatus Krumholzibacteriota bacterium]|nr:hypothetical protein [Candidatus Krumholzibacteriota bacterium]
MRGIVGACIAAAALVALASASCSGPGAVSDLYVLEELEAASAVDDPGERVERLRIFLANNPGHPWRTIAVRRVYETTAGELGDPAGAAAYVDGVLAGETDPGIRGRILYRRFAWLWKADRAGAVAEATRLVDSAETDFRLFLYLGYYCAGEEDLSELTERLLAASLARANDEADRRIVLGAYGEFLAERGREREAEAVLRQAGGSAASEPLGRILLLRGEREAAIDAFVLAAAGMPGARKRVSLDSLYAAVYPGRGDLDERLLAARIVDGPVLDPVEFVDIDGGRHWLGGRRDGAQVVVAWSPT